MLEQHKNLDGHEQDLKKNQRRVIANNDNYEIQSSTLGTRITVQAPTGCGCNQSLEIQKTKSVAMLEVIGNRK